MTKINIKHIANLANIPITEKEGEKLEKELEQTLTHIEHLNEIDTTHVEGTNEVVAMTNVTRDDIVTPSLSQDEALSNAKRTHNGFFVVPVIIEEAVE